MDPEIVLRYTIKALNDTLGPEGLIPSMMVFGTVPTFTSIEGGQKTQKERMKVIWTAKAKMERMTADLRIKTALKAKIPPATQFDFIPRQTVRVFRERSKR